MQWDMPLGAAALYEILFTTYGPQHWWPGETPLEIMVGAVLTQNTAWQNVARAIENLKRQGLLDLPSFLSSPPEVIKAAIRPAGFYNVKYTRLRNLLAAIAAWGMENLTAMSTETLRRQLLAVQGIGPETADSILLYALRRPCFVIDAYTRRLLVRLGHTWAAQAPYEELQAWFTQQLAPTVELYNEYHALIVAHCKTRCRSLPLCQGCPLQPYCQGYSEQTRTS